MQKYIHFLILTVLLLMALPSHAVLKERDISSSLSILRQELNTYRHDLDKQQNDLRLQQQMVVKELITVGNQSQQNALMLKRRATSLTLPTPATQPRNSISSSATTRHPSVTISPTPIPRSAVMTV